MCESPEGTFGVLDLTCVLVWVHTRRFLDGNKLLSCWFLKAAAGERVWFGGVVGYCTHWLLSQHTHSHLKHTHLMELKGGCWISHSHPELFRCWKRDHLTLSYPPPSPGLSGMWFETHNLGRILASFTAKTRSSNLKL